ncbi:MAG: PAS domain-containing protein [Calditrichaeota bacterium]|nr:MAG: PAS domain-containing protein [Calditrichota bacterium]
MISLAFLKSHFQDPRIVGDERALNIWFIRLRWIAIAVAILLINTTIFIFHYLSPEAFPPLMVLIGLLILSNLLYTFWLNSGKKTRYLPEIQIVADLFFLTAMLHYSGGIENPLTYLYIFHVILSGILLPQRRCYQIVFLGFFLYTLLAFSELFGTLPHYTLQIFPHTPDHHHGAMLPGGAGQPMELIHAAHYAPYVITASGLQFLVMLLTAFFITTVMAHLREAQRRTREQQQRLEKVLQATGAGLIIMDAGFRPLWYNQVVQHWFGEGHGETETPDTTLEQWVKQTRDSLETAFQQGKVISVEREQELEDHQTHVFQVTLAPVRDQKGDIYQVVELIQDITEKKFLEAEMLHAARMVTLGTMAAGIAHEVGNPLASISTRLQLMETEKDPAFIQASLRLLRKEIARIERIVRGVAQFGRAAPERWELCSVNQVLEETVEILKYHKLARDRCIQLNLDKSLKPILAVGDQLKQVFLNLGLNALEATDPGGQLIIQTRRRGSVLEIAFTDTGCGIAPEKMHAIFQPFYTTKPEGTGLGLFIAQHIVQAHGGSLNVESQPGKGSTFTIKLPIRRHPVKKRS